LPCQQEADQFFARPSRIGLLSMVAEPIKLVSDDEAKVILEVADDAADRLGWPPIRGGPSANSRLSKSIWTLQLRQSLSYGTGGSIGKLMNNFSPGTISRDDLILLAPYIDDWLNGNAPPFELPAEYDRRIEFLDDFKKRMVSSNVWPAGVLEKVRPRSTP
jgi:hypothetical protein